VSRTTVSHVLSGNRPVAPATRTRVEQVIDELSYRPNGLARSLRIQRTHTVALIIPDITNPFYPMVARGLDDALGVRYRTLICNTDADREQERAFAADVSDRKADGMVIVAFQVEARDLADILELGMPLVSIGDRIDDPRVDLVLPDDEHGAFEVTRYLLSAGHVRIGFVWEPDGPGQHRLEGYRRALREVGIPYDEKLTALGGWNRPGGHAAMARLLEASDPPSAVFCANDLMAIGAIAAARAVGRRIPEEVAIVGYDDIDAAAMVSPELTTVANPAYEAGQAAGRFLLDRITGSYTGERRTLMLRPGLVKRRSA